MRLKILRVIVDQNSDRFASDFEVSRSEKNEKYLSSIGQSQTSKKNENKMDGMGENVILISFLICVDVGKFLLPKLFVKKKKKIPKI